jgi:hypothetical protein
MGRRRRSNGRLERQAQRWTREGQPLLSQRVRPRWRRSRKAGGVRLALDEEKAQGGVAAAMPNEPERSFLATLWAAFIGLFPGDDVREARKFLGHVGLTLVMLAGLWVLQHAYAWFLPHERLFGWVPVKWFFDAAEAGVLFRFAWRAIFEPWWKRRR